MANVIIFSKDRPIQLDLLLRSFKLHFKEWEQTNKTVIYLATSGEFSKGYNIVNHDHPEFKFIEQGMFRYDLLKAVDPTQQYTMFLVDDIVFKADFSASDPIFGMLKNNPQMSNISLRLHPNLTYCYATNSSMRQPQMIRHVKNHYMVWRWPGAEGDWGYSNSLDGDIFNTSFIAPLLTTYDYLNPNQLESILNDQRIIKGIWPTYKCCYDGFAKLINNPTNRVQNEFKNRVENSSSPEELNKLFLQGKRISLDGISDINNGAVHYPFEYKIV
jgi:hypothetical protein